MKLQDARIAGLRHENLQIRSEILGVLVEEREPGDGIAMQAIRQIEKHGWRDAFEHSSQIRELPHTEESVEWAVARLEETAPGKDQENQQLHLAAWFCEAPVEWLAPRIDRIVATVMGESPPAMEKILANAAPFVSRAVDRLAASGWSGAKCREELDQVLEGCISAEGFPHAEIQRMEVICEVLAALGDCDEEAAGEWLDIDEPDPERETELKDYRAGAALMIIGRGKVRPPLERIIRLFELDWDWLNELVEDAIVGSGNRDTLRDLLPLFPGLPWHAKLFLTSVLAQLRFDGFEEPLIEVLRSEDADDIRVRLARVLALYGSEKALGVAKEIAAEDPGDPERHDILSLICVDEVLTGRETPWTRNYLREMKRSFLQRRIASDRMRRLMEGFKRPPAVARPVRKVPAPGIPAAPRPLAGRNDPCPCGSGKKYKKCCL